MDSKQIKYLEHSIDILNKVVPLIDPRSSVLIQIIEAQSVIRTVIQMEEDKQGGE